MQKKGPDTHALMEVPSTAKTKVDTDAELEVSTCGFGSFRPRCFRKLATIGVFTATLSVPILVTSTLSTYINSQVTTLEKQFGLSSSQTGILMAANDIGYVTVAIVVSYFAPRVHIPRFLAVCFALFGFAGVICSLPHFLYGVETIGDAQPSNITSGKNNLIGQLCPGVTQSQICDRKEETGNKPRSHATSALIIIGAGMFLQGVTKAPRHPFLLTYIDDNVVRTKTGYYLGIMITVGILGPVFSYSLGGLFTRIYVTLEDTPLHPRHPRWVGAWWLGYIVFGVASLVTAFPSFLFPRKLRGAPETPGGNEKQELVAKGTEAKWSLIKEAKTYFQLLGKILANPVYMLLLLATIVLIFSVGGIHSFLPKYIENQFGLETWKANLIIAGLSLSTACVGTFVGGWISKRLKMGGLTALKWNCGLYLFVLIFFALAFIFGCEQPEIVNIPGSEETDCISNCSCNNNEYFPVCGSDNNIYFSPCHAGCQHFESGTYTNCTCIPGGEATSGTCQYNCPFIIPYFVAVGCSFFLSTMSIIPKITSEIRCVAEEEKPLSVGVQTVMASLFGWMLGPVVFGRLIDTSCLLWDSECGQTGACVLYDLADFRVKFHGLYLAARALAFLATLLALIVALKTKRMHPKPQEVPLNADTDNKTLSMMSE